MPCSVSPAEAFEAFLQEEHADQVAAVGGLRKLRHRARFELEPLRDARSRRGARLRSARTAPDSVRAALSPRSACGRSARGSAAPARCSSPTRACAARAGAASDGESCPSPFRSSSSGDASASTRPIAFAFSADAARPVSISSSARRCADQARQARGAAPARMKAELDFGKADPRRRIARGDAIAARERDLGAAAHAVAVDRGDGRAGQARELLEDALAVLDVVEHRAAISRSSANSLRSAPTDESGRLAGTDHDAAAAARTTAARRFPATRRALRGRAR